jgi:hypothetical protein
MVMSASASVSTTLAKILQYNNTSVWLAARPIEDLSVPGERQ